MNTPHLPHSNTAASCDRRASLRRLSTLLAIALSAGLFLPRSVSAAAEPSRIRFVLPGKTPFLVAPDQPPSQATIYCCDANSCVEVSTFACLPNEITLVCDSNGLCVPAGQINTRPLRLGPR